MGALFTLRWAARDLRRRWPQVVAISLIIAIGTGAYAALGSTAAWRRESNDASFAQLHMYDLRVELAEGTDADTGSLLAVLDTLPDPAVVATAEERLVAPTQLDASTPDEVVLVPGRIVGMDLSSGGPHVTDVYVAAGDGRDLEAADAGRPIAVIEQNFADFHDLPAQGTVRVAGGQEVRTVGKGLAPEYFLVMTEEGGFFAQANFGVLFTSLETAQRLTGKPDRVNDLVLELGPDADPELVVRQLEAALEESGLGATVMRPEDEDAYRLLYDDIDGDRRFWNIFSVLILAGAAFGAFNLASRMVESQRREIGIGMALGWGRGRLAARPLLVGAQIAVLGALFGVAMGLLIMAALRPVYTGLLPLPTWRTELQVDMFLRAAALGFVLPFAATAWPVGRAVRVMPVDAITTAHASARSGLAPLLRHLAWPVSAFRRMPLGNVLRTPRRTLLTALGIGAAISTLVVLFGMLDSFDATMDRNRKELLGDHPDRVAVALGGLVATDGPEMAAVADAASVGPVEPVLRVGGTLVVDGHEDVEVIVEALDLRSDLWAPTVDPGGADEGGPGIMIARKAADDLGVRVGDEIDLEHPTRTTEGYAIVRTPVVVTGVHPSPFRFNAYVDQGDLVALGVAGTANAAYVLPAAGATPDDVEQELFAIDGVASVQPIAVSTRIVQDSLEEFVAVFRVLQLFILFLAVLIAYNATSINADERARERATLFAFGIRLRRVLSLETAEGVLIGLLGTAIGLGAGLLLVRWIITSIVSTTMPDMGLDVVVSAGTVLTSVALGVLATAVAPLLTLRRLRRMDIPGTLRVVE